MRSENASPIALSNSVTSGGKKHPQKALDILIDIPLNQGNSIKSIVLMNYAALRFASYHYVHFMNFVLMPKACSQLSP